MAQATGIEWTDASSNPLKYRDRATGKDVWACVKTSPGCAHCYSEAMARRFARGGPFTRDQMGKVEPYLCEKELRRLLTSKTLAGKKVFVCDMTDLFGEWVPDQILDRVFAALAVRGDVTFQVLTKRAARMAEYVGRLARGIAPLEAAARAMGYTFKFRDGNGGELSTLPWPIPNVWLGVSVENQAAADERVPHLLGTPAAVRFLSCEPLLGEVNLRRVDLQSDCPKYDALAGVTEFTMQRGPRVDWVIVGGESGGGARPCNACWVRSLVAQCERAGVACFVKQLGANPHDGDAMRRVPGYQTEYTAEQARNPTPEMLATLGACFEAATLELRDRKGGDMEEWPEDLKVREFPAVRPPHAS